MTILVAVNQARRGEFLNFAGPREIDDGRTLHVPDEVVSPRWSPTLEPSREFNAGFAVKQSKLRARRTELENRGHVRLGDQPTKTARRTELKTQSRQLCVDRH